MTALAEKLETLEYGVITTPVEFLDEGIAELLPKDYCQFLRTFPRTGFFDADICALGRHAAPGAPDKLYPVTCLFAFSENESDDLARIRDNDLETPRHFLTIGRDAFDNHFLLDLRNESRGRVYYHDHETPLEHGVYLVAESFSAFIESLRRA